MVQNNVNLSLRKTFCDEGLKDNQVMKKINGPHDKQVILANIIRWLSREWTH